MPQTDFREQLSERIPCKHPRPPRRAADPDGIPPDMCVRCGLIGQHETVGDCIDQLRDELATLQCKFDRLRYGKKRRASGAR